jgi:hypothetical protein
MGVAVLQRASELREVVASVSGWRDPVGVLSVTAGVEPGAGTGGTPPWAIALENDLARLRHEGSSVVRRCLDEAAANLEDLLDPVAEGRGRALYIALDSGEHRQLELQAALPTGARIGPVAHVLPLLQALEDGEPAGLVMASKDHVVVLESQLAQLSELERIDLEPWVGDWWPEMKGPSRANPLRGQHAVSHRDRYAHRLDVAYDRTRREACKTLAALAAERRWTRAVLAGDPRTTGVLRDAIRGGGVASTATLAVNLEGIRTEQALGRLAELLESLTADSSRHLVRSVRDAAAEGITGASGLADVLRALQQDRAGALVIDSERACAGIVESDGTLRAPDRGEATVDLTDLIVARALESGAEVRPVRGAAAGVLEDCGGIAAHLRW